MFLTEPWPDEPFLQLHRSLSFYEDTPELPREKINLIILSCRTIHSCYQTRSDQQQSETQLFCFGKFFLLEDEVFADMVPHTRD